MARHTYNIEITIDKVLDEEDVQDVEAYLRGTLEGLGSKDNKIITEYVDSEG